MSTTSEPHIFLSYSRRNKDVQQRVVAWLREHGFKVWVDNENLVPGTPAWEEEVEGAIRNAFAVVVILSPESKNSEWVRREVAFADQYEKRIFPVRIGGNDDSSLPIRLITRQYIDLRRDEEAGLNSLVAALTSFSEERGSLEMEGPQVKEDVAAASPPALRVRMPPQEARPSRKWILPAGIVLIAFILSCGALFTLYEILPRPTAPKVAATQTSYAIKTATLPVTSSSTHETQAEAPTAFAATITPTVAAPDQISRILTNVQVVDLDGFDDDLGKGWNIDVGKIENSALEITGNENWLGAYRDRKFGEGEGVVIDFEYSADALAEIYLEHGDWDTDSYRRFGMYVGGNRATLDEYAGADDRGGAKLSGDLILSAGKTYTLLMAILPDSEFLEVVLDPSQPSAILSHRVSLDQTWAGLPWTFYIGVNGGMIRLDNYRGIRFSGAN